MRALTAGLALLILLGALQPAGAGEGHQPDSPVATPPTRTLAQAWTPTPAEPAPGATFTTCSPPPSEPSPVYTRLSFWLSVGIAAAAGVVVGVLWERRNHGLDMPATTFWNKQF